MITPDVQADGYAEALAEATAAIKAARTHAVLAVNRSAIGLYWSLGSLIVDRQHRMGWKGHVVRRLSDDLRHAFPDMTGLSVGNLGYMRRMVTTWPEAEQCLRMVGNLPWGHVQILLDRVDDDSRRDWYALAAVEYGWSRAVLENQIMSQLAERAGRAPSNFERLLPSGDSELMQQMTKDPYNLDFLTLRRGAAERELEVGPRRADRTISA